jgi:hypothetical protein
MAFFRTSSSAADGDQTGSVFFIGKDDAGNDTTYGSLTSHIVDASNTTEDGRITLSSMKAGTLTDTLHVVSGNVGVGTSSPDVFSRGYTRTVGISSSGSTSLAIQSASGPQYPAIEMGRGSSRQFLITNEATKSTIGTLENTPLTFLTNSTERARLDASGNLLIGGTNANPVGNHVSQIIANGANGLGVHRDGGTPFKAGTDADRSVIEVYKQGALVGSIGVASSDNFYIECLTTNHSGLAFGEDSMVPRRNGSYADNAVDLGSASTRFDDIYATNGTIQTSDRNEKQDIAELSDAEVTAAKAISKLFKTFKWNDSVAEKGDAARTHSGVIAQEVEQAMTDAGLDAGDYAFFISTTWWETQTEVPAVEADEENGVEAQEAYTRTDTYDTAEEAPEGATERNRKGIRYPQLLSFIGAATEQRLASIESRLDALEA